LIFSRRQPGKTPVLRLLGVDLVLDQQGDAKGAGCGRSHDRDHVDVRLAEGDVPAGVVDPARWTICRS
jgi:hypothetical protein